MKPRLHPSPALLTLTLILSFVVHFPVTLCQETRPYYVCGDTVLCGYVRLDYPFWGSGRPAYCGHPGFQLTCESDIPLLNYQSVNYRVLDTDTSTQTITLARNDLWTDFCPEYLHNTSYNSTLFNVNSSDQENLSLYYGCNASAQSLGVDNLFSCNLNQTQSDCYFFRTILVDSRMTSLLAQCQNHITVPVDQYLAGQLASPDATTDDLREALAAGFNLHWMAKNAQCDQCMQSNGRCGSNLTSPGLFACYSKHGGTIGTLWKIIIGVSSIVAGIICGSFAVLYKRKRSLRTQGTYPLHTTPQLLGTSTNNEIEIFIRNYGAMTPKRFSYSEIEKITNSFVEKLGYGGYGSVYKGQLPNGQLVAVKLLNKATGEGKDFINEVGSIGRTSHVNVVTLLGFCFDGTKRALIYEFMPNGSLDKFLRHDGSRLDWNTLFGIAKGIARGLEYLHRGCNTRIVHFDIKPHNILLDGEFVPKISDFGLAKLCTRKESIVTVTGARGTAGYMAPEVFFKSLGGASHKSDVYSYGMMVLEMSGARKDNVASTTDTSATYFPDTIYNKVEGGNLGVDGVKTKEEEELARKMVMVSLWCIQSDPSDRPSISKVVEMLEGSFQSLQLPPKRFWSSPTGSPRGTSPLSTQSSSDERVLTIHAAGKDLSS